MKLELKHLAPYLPYGLNVEHKQGKNKASIDEVVRIEVQQADSVVLSTITDKWSCYGAKYQDIKPLLHPLSRLTEPTLEGSKVPLIELAKMAYPSLTGWNEAQTLRDYFTSRETTCSQGNKFSFSNGSFIKFSRKDSSKAFQIMTQVPNQLPLLQKLYEWHFDVDDLIGKGLAIAKPLNQTS